MRTKRAHCPSPVELERAYWSSDAELRGHALGCAECGAQWSEIAALADAGRSIPPPPPAPDRREEIRTALLARMSAPPTERRARWRWQLAAPLGAAAAALALAIGWWAWPRGGGEPIARTAPPRAVHARGHILAHAAARYMRASSAPDEIVRLVDGTLSIEVEPLQRGERFRVIIGDAEIEVRGTAFDITAAADHLRAVRVMHGLVEVRPSGGTAILVGGGQAWQPTPAAAAAAAAALADETAARPEATDAGASPSPRSRPSPSRRAFQSRVDPRPAPSGRPAAQQAFDEAWTAMRAGQFARAAEAFARAAHDDDSAPLAEDARYWRAVALARGGDASAAREAFDAFIRAFPSSPRAGEASVMLGWLLFDGRDYTGAARRFRAAVTDPSPRVRSSAAQGLQAVEHAGR
ncbi:MAG TPA: tetratricopeptide repeat protein [Kofleriaceae bacterium]|nr:tetratricopeptide repeat protein [Kofleriaceae bacterium]